MHALKMLYYTDEKVEINLNHFEPFEQRGSNMLVILHLAGEWHDVDECIAKRRLVQLGFEPSGHRPSY